MRFLVLRTRTGVLGARWRAAITATVAARSADDDTAPVASAALPVAPTP